MQSIIITKYNMDYLSANRIDKARESRRRLYDIDLSHMRVTLGINIAVCALRAFNLKQTIRIFLFSFYVL
jgi:hypothetical protein